MAQENFGTINTQTTENNIKCSLYKVKEVIDHNIVCHDALNGWDYENWQPITKNICNALF